jgi:hypothetical protein
VEGAAGLHVPEDRRARRRGGSNEERKSRWTIRREERKNKEAQKQAKMQAEKAARMAEASARESKLAELTKTIGLDAAKEAIRREATEAREAKRKEMRDARNAEKQARKAQMKMNRRGMDFFSHPVLQCSAQHFFLVGGQIPISLTPVRPLGHALSFPKQAFPKIRSRHRHDSFPWRRICDLASRFCGQDSSRASSQDGNSRTDGEPPPPPHPHRRYAGDNAFRPGQCLHPNEATPQCALAH